MNKAKYKIHGQWAGIGWTVLTFLLLYGFGMATSGSAAPRSKPAPMPSLSEVVKGINSYGSNIRSCTGSISITDDGPRDNGPKEPERLQWSTLKGKWWISGRKFRIDETARYAFPLSRIMVDAGSGKAVEKLKNCYMLRRVILSDGVRASEEEFTEKGVLSPRFELPNVDQAREISQSIDYSRVPGFCTSRAKRVLLIPRAEYSPKIEKYEMVSGVRCIKIVGSRFKRQKPNIEMRNAFSWWIAPQYGYLVMRSDYSFYDSRKDAGKDYTYRSRTEVKTVSSFGKDIYLPKEVDYLYATYKPNGKLLRVLGHQRAKLTFLSVNKPISKTQFQVALGYPDPQPVTDAPGCGYDSMLDYCELLNDPLDKEEAGFLRSLFAEQPESSLLQLSEILESRLHLPMAGLQAEISDLSALNQPVIVHGVGSDKIGHFFVIENVGSTSARILDKGTMHILSLSSLQKWFSGNLLAVDGSKMGSTLSKAARALVSEPIQPVDEAPYQKNGRLHKHYFTIRNVGLSDLRLRMKGTYPEGLDIFASLPLTIPPGVSKDIAVMVRSKYQPKNWAVVVAANDPLRPVLWLGAGLVLPVKKQQEQLPVPKV